MCLAYRHQLFYCYNLLADRSVFFKNKKGSITAAAFLFQFLTTDLITQAAACET